MSPKRWVCLGSQAFTKKSDRIPPIAELELSLSQVANSNARLLHQEAFHLKRAPKPLYIHYPPDLCFTGMTELYGIWPAMKSACYKFSVQSSVRLATGQCKSWYYYLFIRVLPHWIAKQDLHRPSNFWFLICCIECPEGLHTSPIFLWTYLNLQCKVDAALNCFKL